MQRIVLAAVLFMHVGFVGPAAAGLPTFEITVSAGVHDRENIPVRISLPVLSSPEIPKSVTLTRADGKTIPAQLTGPELHATKDCWREIHFILPSLKAGQSIALKATLSTEPPPRGEGFSWKDRAGEFTELRFRARPVSRYHYAALDESTKESRERTYKVFHHLFSPK